MILFPVLLSPSHSSGSVFLIPHRLSIWSYCCFPQSETLPSHFLLLQINRTGILGLRMCAGQPLFSLTPVCHFLPLHPTSPQNAASCPSLIASEVPPSPSGMAQDFTLSLSNIQEVRQTTSSMWLDFVQTACCENDWRKKEKAEAYGVFASSWVKHRWIFECCDLGQWMSKTWSLGDLCVVTQICENGD